jgi:hypothetical protein
MVFWPYKTPPFRRWINGLLKGHLFAPSLAPAMLAGRSKTPSVSEDRNDIVHAEILKHLD